MFGTHCPRTVLGNSLIRSRDSSLGASAATPVLRGLDADCGIPAHTGRSNRLRSVATQDLIGSNRLCMCRHRVRFLK
jgi:hypothetical protein